MTEIEEKARTKTTYPPPTREKGQRSLDLPLYLMRNIPYWGMPNWMNGNTWRSAVARQPIATICRETLIANVIDLDWKIEPKDSTKRDELKDEIDYYTKLFERSKNYDYTSTIEWIVKDMLDLPFGAAAEIIREGDRPEGKVLDYILLDGATLFPTLNNKYPVGQYIPQLAIKSVYFPAYAINRVYYSPRTDIEREGWGMAPPEKIYLALELLNRGDVYYANLLLDTPQTGILDLGDMSKDSAAEWVDAWRDMLTGIDPFKIPVLYEHENEVKFIPFQKSPVEIMYDKAIFRYTTIITAGYGITPSDIGIPSTSSGGDTLAGTIRQERQTKRTGFARAKKKVKSFYDFMLPDYLRFHFIDLDDEISVALGRARLASATAGESLITLGVFTPEEWRQQMMADGLINISVPEKLPKEAVPLQAKPNERPSLLGKPVAPSQGGHGEIVQGDLITTAFLRAKNIDGLLLERLAYAVFPVVRLEVSSIFDDYEDAYERDAWLNWHDTVLVSEMLDDVPELASATIKNGVSTIKKSLGTTGIKLFELDEEKASEELFELASEIVCEKDLQEGQKAFIKGEIDNADDYPVTNIDSIDESINELVRTLNETVEEDIIRAIMSGIYKFAVYHIDVEEIEFGGSSDLILLIRDKIDRVCNKLLSETADKFSDIIKSKLDKEEVLEDANTTERNE